MPSIAEVWAAANPYLSLVVLAAVFLLFKYYAPEKIKGRIQHAYAERLETLKIALKAETDSEIEKFKSQATLEVEKLRSQLSIAAAEHNVRFSKLHEKRAEVIAELYGLLAKARSALTSFVSGEDSAFVDEPLPWQERENAAGKALRDLDDMFGPNRIFVPKSVAEKIDQIRQAYGTHYLFGLAGHSSQDEDDRAAILQETAGRITAISVTALIELETEFRKLLGDEIEPSNQR